MSQTTLPIELPKPQEPRERRPTRPDEARVRRPVRNQAMIMVRDLESLIPQDHRVRAVWEFVVRLDLAGFYQSIKAVLDRPGRPVTDPRVLLGLWVYATAEGIGSARRLEKLCEEHDAYRWLCGGVSVNYHTLSDFRGAHGKAMDELLTKIVATLMASKLVTLNQVAQDGMKIRASAGAASYHRRDSLEECLAKAEEQVERLAEEREHPDPAASQRELSARERGAKERVKRVEEALRQLPAVEAAKERQKRTRGKARSKVTMARVSTTDPRSRLMKMPDGGYRPAYNVQLATDVGSGVIVGTAVVNKGSDSGQAPPVEEQVAQRFGRHAGAYLIDGGFAQRKTITALERRGVTVYAPVRPPRTTTSGRQRSSPRQGDTPQVVAWRQRMETKEAKDNYRLRAATAEWANAQARLHGLRSFSVRGLEKVACVVLLVVVTHNVLRALALGA